MCLASIEPVTSSLESTEFAASSEAPTAPPAIFAAVTALSAMVKAPSPTEVTSPEWFG